MRCISIFSLSLLLVACGDRANDTSSSGDDGSGGSGGSGGSTTGGTGGSTGGDGGMGGSGGTPEPLFRATASGTATWQVTFDDDALATGATDCSYTRTYTATQDESAKWLCPSCEIILFADVAMTDGQAECFSQISPGGMPSPTEWIGWGDGTYYRGNGIRMTDQGTAVIADDALTIENQVLDLEHAAGGLFQFDVTGSFTIGEEQGDPMNGFNVPDTYACGWPKADPPEYTGDYTVELGQTVPDGVFMDACEEAVRLHDLAGDYLVVDMSAMDCPPCKQMAGSEKAFEDDMAAQGIDVHVITLLAPSLEDTLGETQTYQLELWAQAYELTSPVLADRGWGLTMFLEAFDGDAAYPSWVVVDPDLNIIQIGQGFAGWNEMSDTILDHAAQ